MSDNERRKLLAITETGGFDETIGRAVRKVEEIEEKLGPGGRADIFNASTGQHVARIESPTSSSGYTRAFGDAWDRMLQRRAVREAVGGSSADA